ncbi:MAG TPA: tannase/feruloyl esterase family alpha/beta hydrolase, partial [Vicinamibacterales bacterium]|nr:tannase/feruloyl esterase family alpha/beta hydrolase [Vicinamibacterales bacterium]
ISPQNSIDYYEKVRQTMGAAETDRFMRLFMAPGMMHCGGGPGPNAIDALTPMEQWVEHGVAPSQMIASHATSGAPGTIDRTRPLCAYPRVAVYKGSGDTNDAANFECKAR